MRPFILRKADSERDAIAAGHAGARYIAGGTTLVDLMREEVEHPEWLVDINALPLAQIRADGDDLVIGALARMADVAAHAEVRRLQPLVAEALLEGASPQIRNMASIGGNLMQRARCPYFRLLDAACNKRDPGSGCAAREGIHHNHAILGGSDHCFATHPSDLAVALIALDARMRVRGPQGERAFAVETLFRLPGDTPHLEHTLRPGELILDVRVPGGAHARRARYLKVRDRASYEFALVSAAVALDMEGDTIRSARIACGGVGTMPWRMREAELALVGKRRSASVFEAAAHSTVTGAVPAPDNRYKVQLLPRTVVRALEMASEVSA